MNKLVMSDFESSAEAVLAYLAGRFGFSLWMVARKDGEQWIVLKADDKHLNTVQSYGIGQGNVLMWSDTLCARMVAQGAPHVAPDTALVPAYVSAPASRTFDIRAYVGVPLMQSDGSLFGTLCGVDPTPQPQSIVEEQGMIELFGRLLSTVLQKELELNDEARRAERAEADALTDGLTALYNRRGWERLLAAEEARCRRYGHPAFILALDLDGLKIVNDTQGHAAGDAVLQRAASVMQSVAREQDVVARLGGDEFAILGVETDPAGAEALALRLREALRVAGVRASIGVAQRDPTTDLPSALELADQRMYAEKRSGSRRST